MRKNPFWCVRQKMKPMEAAELARGKTMQLGRVDGTKEQQEGQQALHQVSGTSALLLPRRDTLLSHPAPDGSRPIPPIPPPNGQSQLVWVKVLFKCQNCINHTLFLATIGGNMSQTTSCLLVAG